MSPDWVCGRRLAHCANERRHDLDRRDKLVERLRLREECSCAELGGPTSAGRPVTTGENDHLRAGAVFLEQSQRFEPLEVRELEVQEDDVRIELESELDGLASGAGDAHHFQPIRRHGRAECMREQTVVVGNQQAQRGGATLTSGRSHGPARTEGVYATSACVAPTRECLCAQRLASVRFDTSSLR